MLTLHPWRAPELVPAVDAADEARLYHVYRFLQIMQERGFMRSVPFTIETYDRLDRGEFASPDEAMYGELDQEGRCAVIAGRCPSCGETVAYPDSIGFFAHCRRCE